MENATDALKMAGAVLIFVLAISIIILAFGQVRETADIILDYKDRETVYIDENYYYENNKLERQVGLETIIPSIYRSYLENYKIVFEGLETPLYYKIINQNEMVPVYYIDLEKEIIGGNNQKSEFLCGILYNDFKESLQDDFEKKFNVRLDNCKSLYEQLNKNEMIITEYLGVYYQNDDISIPEIMKDEKRIITYKIGGNDE